MKHHRQQWENARGRAATLTYPQFLEERASQVFEAAVVSHYRGWPIPAQSIEELEAITAELMHLVRQTSIGGGAGTGRADEPRIASAQAPVGSPPSPH